MDKSLSPYLKNIHSIHCTYSGKTQPFQSRPGNIRSGRMI